MGKECLPAHQKNQALLHLYCSQKHHCYWGNPQTADSQTYQSGRYHWQGYLVLYDFLFHLLLYYLGGQVYAFGVFPSTDGRQMQNEVFAICGEKKKVIRKTYQRGLHDRRPSGCIFIAALHT